MKNATVFALLLMALTLLTCQSDDAPGKEVNEEAKAANPDLGVEGIVSAEKRESGLYSVREINAFLDSIKMNYDSLLHKGPLTITRGDNNMEVTVSFVGYDPRIIHVQDDGMEHRYYLKGKKVVALQELLFQENLVRENLFHYSDEELLSAQTRTAITQEELTNATFAPYQSPYGDLDFRLKVTEVNISATKFIYGE